MWATAGGNNRQHIFLESAITNDIDFCHNALLLSDISAHDISSALFFSLPKSNQDNNASPSSLLLVWFSRCCIHDNDFSQRHLLKDFNCSSTSKYFINENFTTNRCKLFLDAWCAVKDKHLDGTRTSYMARS